jgi:hypothetical protein
LREQATFFEARQSLIAGQAHPLNNPLPLIGRL